MGFKKNLKEKLKDQLTQEELVLLPSGFQTVGNIMIIKLNPILINKKELIGKACIELNPYIKSVYLNLGKIKGTFREPENIKFISGIDNPIVTHKEHGVIYKFDITKIMFSKGNLNERKFIATLVKENEIIVDMFAGIGYFSLPIAKHAYPKQIYSIELNPVSYKFLVENIKINHFENVIIPLHGDCKDEVLKLSEKNIKADRVIMGILPSPKDFIEYALSLVKPEGTIYHYEGITDKKDYMTLFIEFQQHSDQNKIKCKLLSYRFVKSFGPNLYHVVLDIRASKS